jgi:hypothetical protein
MHKETAAAANARAVNEERRKGRTRIKRKTNHCRLFIQESKINRKYKRLCVLRTKMIFNNNNKGYTIIVPTKCTSFY